MSFAKLWSKTPVLMDFTDNSIVVEIILLTFSGILMPFSSIGRTDLIQHSLDPIYFGLSFQVGQKKARKKWFLVRFYSTEEANKMGLVNKVVPVSSRSICPPFM